MPTGTVKKWNDERGFGFIGRDDMAADIFVHASGIAGSLDRLAEGKRVSFEVGEGRDGRQAAKNVRLI